MNDSADLFRHVSAEKALFYRCIMDVFAAAKRQYRLQLRPDEVLAEAVARAAGPGRGRTRGLRLREPEPAGHCRRSLGCALRAALAEAALAATLPDLECG